jgi:hypothetical protein
LLQPIARCFFALQIFPLSGLAQRAGLALLAQQQLLRFDIVLFDEFCIICMGSTLIGIAQLLAIGWV